MTEITSAKTKSGTTVYTQGGTRAERSRVLDNFLKYYNRNFTVAEQKVIGNVWYNLATTKYLRAGGHLARATTETFVGEDLKKFNK